jgi:hypothetical protein
MFLVGKPGAKNRLEDLEVDVYNIKMDLGETGCGGVGV